MSPDGPDFRDFYRSPLGAITASLLRAQLRHIWPHLTGQTLLGLGHTDPYLDLWHPSAARSLAILSLLPAAPRPPHGAMGCIADSETLPLPDLSIDRVLLVHGLEHAESARRLLRELWRILRHDGRMIVVVPNRVSPWAYLQRTPFGSGQPYTAAQLGRLLASMMFQVENRRSALFIPPLHNRPRVRNAVSIERVGQRFAPQAGGAILIEARKDLAAPIGLVAAQPVSRRASAPIADASP
jgi:SAM-dependent methyltransferase